MKPMLLLVDLQHDYLAAPGLEPPPGRIVAQAADLLDFCRKLEIPVAHVHTTVTREPDNRMAHWKQANCWRCEAGTMGHQAPPALAPQDGDVFIDKSGFSPFTTGKLKTVLEARGIDALIVSGIHLHACVRQTALDAHQLGYAVWIVDDAAGSDDPVHAAITRRYLEARGVRFITAGALETEFGNERLDASQDHPRATRASLAEAAANFSATWRRTHPRGRVALLDRAACLLQQRAGSLAELMAREIGKPVRFGRVEMERTAAKLRAVADRLAPADATCGEAVVRRQPHGVVAVISPWNNPAYLSLGKIACAMAFGNTVVWKPAPQACLVSRALFQILRDADWPDGLVMLREGDRREAVAVMNDPHIAAVTITGSSEAGFSAQEICARRRIPLQAELGGNNATIIWPDADLPHAAACVAAGAFDFAGQRCTANRRVIVERGCRDEFLRLLVMASAELHWGDPLCPETRIGPVVNAAQQRRIASTVERAVAACGAALRPQGAGLPVPPCGAWAWYPPTILCCEDRNHEIVQAETFGPVLVLQTAQEWDDAMRLCNGVSQGLAAAIFTRSPEIVARFLDQADAGILKINQSTADAAMDVPFGGWKASGVGLPEHGRFDMEFYTRPQTVYGVMHGGMINEAA